MPNYNQYPLRTTEFQPERVGQFDSVGYNQIDCEHTIWHFDELSFRNIILYLLFGDGFLSASTNRIQGQLLRKLVQSMNLESQVPTKDSQWDKYIDQLNLINENMKYQCVTDMGPINSA